MDDTTTGVGASDAEVATQPESQDAATPVAAQAAEKVDLTKLEEFKKYQSKSDARIAQAEAAARKAQEDARRMAAALDQVQQAQMSTLDPEEQIAQLKAALAEQKRAMFEAERQSILANRAAQIVAVAGLDFNDPRLDEAKRLGVTDEGVLAIATAVARIASEDRQAALLAAQAEREKLASATKVEVQRAKVAALDEAGVTATSSVATAIAPRDERAETIAAFRQRWARLRGSGNGGAPYVAFQKELREAGLTVADLGY